MYRILILVSAAWALTACGGPSKTQQQQQQQQPETEEKMLAGGYSQQHALTEQDKALFETVTAELDGVRYTPQSVARQVVAGTNYRFVCKAVTATRTPETYQAEMVVFQPLPGRGEARITKITRL